MESRIYSELVGMKTNSSSIHKNEPKPIEANNIPVGYGLHPRERQINWYRMHTIAQNINFYTLIIRLDAIHLQCYRTMHVTPTYAQNSARE